MNVGKKIVLIVACCLVLVATTVLVVGLTNTSKTDPFTVTYQTNGGRDIASKTVESGTQIENKTTSKSCCIFDGWYDNAELSGTVVSFPFTILKDTTFFAKWNESHTIVEFDAKLPTCTAIGWKAYEKCSKCDYTTYEEQAAEHTVDEFDEKLPTCTAIGWKAYEKCRKCGYTTYEEQAATGHAIVEYDAKLPTCTAVGWKAYEKCGKCGYTTYEQLAASRHEIVEFDEELPTCTTIGWKAYEKCNRCVYTTYEQQSATGHKIVELDEELPTCTTIGWKAYEECNRCVYTTYEQVAATGHRIESGVCANEFTVGLIYKATGNTYALTGIGTATGDIKVADTYNGKAVTHISEGSFIRQPGLTRLIIPNGVTSIGISAVYGCINLLEISIPSSVTIIERYAFDTLEGLTSILVDPSNSKYKVDNSCLIEISTKKLILGCQNSIIPNYVTSIDEHAFSDCINLTEVTIPSSVTSIGWAAFSGCSSLKSINIPSSVTNIGEAAFSGCSSLTSISVPSSITSIGRYAFNNCSGLTSISVDPSNSKYKSDNNCLIEISTNILMQGCKNSIIPNYVTSISEFSFSRCSALTSIIIPSSVTSIGNYAFSRCSALTSIIIPSSVIIMGESVFYNAGGPISIYCQARSKPKGWHNTWSNGNTIVTWGYSV